MFPPPTDALPNRRVPWVTIALIVVNVLVFVAGHLPADRQAAGSTRQIDNHDVWLTEYGAIPCEVSGRCANQDAVVVVDGGLLDPQPRQVSAQVDQHAPALTLVTSMFLHATAFHLVSNILLLWLFGRHVEDAMRPATFVPFLLLGGMVAGIAQVLAAPGASIPTVGASGIVATVMGAHVGLYPRLRVLWLPSWTIVVAWIGIQAVGVVREVIDPLRPGGGVAYAAHFAGFAIGLATVSFFAERRNPLYTELYGNGDGDDRGSPPQPPPRDPLS